MSLDGLECKVFLKPGPTSVLELAPGRRPIKAPPPGGGALRSAVSNAQWSALLACLAEQEGQWLSEGDGLGPVTLGLVRRYRSDPLAGAQCQRLKSRNNFTFDSLGSGLCNTIGDEM